MEAIKNIIIILFSVAFAIIVCELYLRYDDSYVFPEQYSYDLSDTSSESILIPENGFSTKYVNPSQYKFTDKIDFTNYSSKKRLLILGDSFVGGFKYVSEKKDFPEQLKSLLPYYKNNIFNMGIGGKSLPHYIDWVRNLKLNENDTIIIVLYENDILLDTENCSLINKYQYITKIRSPLSCELIAAGTRESIENNNFLKKLNNSIRKYKTIKLIKNTLYQYKIFQKIYTREIGQNLWSNFESEENIYVRESLIFLKNYILSKNSNVLFTYFPNTHEIKRGKEKNKRIWNKFISNMSTNGVEILDPYEFFYINASEEKMIYSFTDYHPNEEANYLMAQYLSKFVK